MNKKGFSLIEIMISIAIFMMVIILVNSVFNLSKKINDKNSNLAELIQNARVSLDRLSRELRQSADLVTNISSSTPAHSILFQDGHDLDEITYIQYSLDGSDLIREHIKYYFSINPSTYVYYDSIDINGFGPIATTTKQIIGEYYNSMDIINVDGLLTIDLDLTKNNYHFNILSDVYIRNW